MPIVTVSFGYERIKQSSLVNEAPVRFGNPSLVVSRRTWLPKDQYWMSNITTNRMKGLL